MAKKKKRKKHSAPAKKRGPSKAAREARDLRRQLAAEHCARMKALRDLSRGVR